jgi:hypothetical protein
MPKLNVVLELEHRGFLVELFSSLSLAEHVRRLEISLGNSRTTAGGMGYRRNDLTGLNHFAEGLAVGILTDEAWVENVPRVTR